MAARIESLCGRINAAWADMDWSPIQYVSRSFSRAELAYRPMSLVPIDESQTVRLMKLIGVLEELDDVDEIYANFDAPADVLERVAG